MEKQRHSFKNSYETDRNELFLPTPSIKDPYVYLKILQNYDKGIYNTAWVLTHNAIDTIGRSGDDAMANALDFLKSVADAQFEHEKNFLQEEINKLSKIDSQNQTYKNIINFLQTSPDKLDYFKLTKYLNQCLQDIDAAEQRLKNISDVNKAKNSKDFEAIRNATEGLESLISDFTHQRFEFKKSKEEFIRQITILYFTDEDAPGNKLLKATIASQIPQNKLRLVAAMALIQKELAMYLYDNSSILQEEDAIFEQNFKSHFDNFKELLKNKKFFGDTQAILENQNGILDSAINLMKIKTSNQQRKTNQEAIQELTELENLLEINSLSNQPDAKKFLKALGKIHVTWQDTSKFSLLEELKLLANKTINGGAHLGQLNTGTDTLGYVIVDYDNSDNKNNETKINRHLTNLHKQLNNSKNQPANTSQIYETALKKMDKALTELKKAFIIHNSTKFYTTYETRSNKSKYSTFSHFSGRKMNLFNYIDSIATFGDFMGFNTDWLKFCAYQLSDAAIGSDMIGPLEEYFTLFAGIIMFDDFSIIAKEITQNLQYEKLENIHLYQLQGIYVPASYFLQQTYNAMVGIKDSLNRFSATITKPTSTDLQYKKPTKKEEQSQQWKELRDTAKNNTHIRLAFGANFLEFASQIYNA